MYLYFFFNRGKENGIIEVFIAQGALKNLEGRNRTLSLNCFQWKSPLKGRDLLQKDIYFADFDTNDCSEEGKKSFSFEGFEHCFCTFTALLMKASSQTCYCWNTACPGRR